MITDNLRTEANIKKIKDFTEYLKYNFNNHRKQFKNGTNLDDIENSIAFLKDYAEVSEKLVKIINEYCDKMGMEL